MATIERVVRNSSGDRVAVELRIESMHARESERDIYLEPVTGEYLRVSVMGECAPKGVRFGTNASSYGQVRDECPNDMRRVWARWHLNDMRAGCAHQHERAWNVGDVCAFCGYAYGSAWLLERLTVEGARELLDVFAPGEGWHVIGRDGFAVAVTQRDPMTVLHDLQGQSADYALTHGGYSVA